MEKEPCNNQINILEYIYVIHLEILMFSIFTRFSLSICTYLFIISLQNVNNQIDNIHLPEADRVNTAWSA